jgi:hypothetical protein
MAALMVGERFFDSNIRPMKHDARMSWWLWLVGSGLIWVSLSLALALAAGRVFRHFRAEERARRRGRGYA